MAKHKVDYFTCSSCGSLQTEQPFWLHEAYASNLGDLDCGAAQRNLHNFAACSAIARIWSLQNIVDFGGGDGLLCRLLRDRRLNCFVEDKYGSATYALGFTQPDFVRPDAIVAFEVLEHFVDPESEIGALFARQPTIIFGTTERFTGQGADWWYLSKRSGHHVFFYSPKAMQHIANSHGYRLIEQGSFFLFVQSARYSSLKASLSRLLLKGPVRRLIISLSAFYPARGVEADIKCLQSARKTL
jgi:Methyltransferase domain